MMEYRHESDASRADRRARLPDESADDPAIGEVINDRYAVLSRIAAGPTGKLYRSHDVKTESEVTLKLLAGWAGLDDARIRQIREELTVTRALTGKRSNIALVYDCDVTSDGRVVLVMEPLKGRSLLEVIQQHEPLPVERAVNLAFQIADGLYAAHDLGLVHGALEAEHVLVQGVDAVKIVGFEVARLRTARHGFPRSDLAWGKVNGTRPSDGEGVLTEAADTRAVGMILLEMLASGVRSRSGRIGPLPTAIKPLVMQALSRSRREVPSDDRGALASALSAELSRRPEPSASAIRRRARPRPRRGQKRLIVGGVLAIMTTGLAAWLAWSLLSTPYRPVTVVPQAAPAREATFDVPAPESPVATPTPPLPPPPGDTPVPTPPRVTPRPAPPALATPPPAAPESVPARAPEVARRAPASGSAQSSPEGPDPSAVIDWLIKEKARP